MTTVTTIAARASTTMTMSSSGPSSSHTSSSSSGRNPIQMRLCFSQEQVGLRKPQNNVCKLELSVE